MDGVRSAAHEWNLALGAAGAVEDDFGRLVIGEVAAPALIVRRQPDCLALGAPRDQRDTVDLHSRESGRAGCLVGKAGGAEDRVELDRVRPSSARARL